MKRVICLITALCLVFGSFSFASAVDWSTNDQSNLSNASSKLTSIYNLLSSGGAIYNLLNSISNNVNTIKSYLYDDGHSIAYWVSAIDSWMQPIYTSLTSNLAANLNLEPIISGLNEVTSVQGGGTTYYPWLRKLFELDSFNGASDIGGSFTLFNPLAGGQYSSYTYSGYYNWRYTIGTLLSAIDQSIVSSYAYETQALSQNYNASQNAVNWGSLTTSTFTPVSVADGTFKWLSAIQAPVARLSYVLASDERIEAQEAAAANEEAVVDNFIDSSGDGSASPSDIGSISDLSSGYKSNFGSDATVTGIFNIFNSNNMGWFSQETANQLDTTTPTRRGSSFDTPLLDQQINDIYDQIGVKHD